MFNPEVPRSEGEASVIADSDRSVDSILASKYNKGASFGRVQIEDFLDVYTEEEIKKDNDKLVAVKEKFKSRDGQLPTGERGRKKRRMAKGEALEVIVSTRSEIDDWFGEDAMFQRTAEYDDVLNGVDAVVEFSTEDEGEERIALAIDASMEPRFGSLLKKIRRNMGQVSGGDDPAVVKYFKSEVSDFKGELAGVLPVVVGVDGVNSSKLFEEFAHFITLENNLKERKKSPSLHKKYEDLRVRIREHPVQLIFLEEISVQLEMYERILAENSQSRYSLGEVERVRRIIDGVLKKKKDAGITLGEFEHDEMFSTIKSMTKKSKKSPQIQQKRVA